MTLGEASAYYEENPPRGEFVLVVAGAEEKPEAGCTFVPCVVGERHAGPGAARTIRTSCR